MNLTDYHAKLFAHEITKKYSSDSLEKFAGILSEAQVDLNPHQVEAALFAFKSPFSNGAILADEVGLGKTIEAGILLSQQWAERKRRILIIVPSSLRKQWQLELMEKFFLPSIIMENNEFNKINDNGKRNPFEQDKIVICSYNFVSNKDEYVMRVNWDLVIIDEAHRLRNVWKPENKTANKIKTALKNRKKVLLTATPLQNSLMELYGLISFVDEFTFGDKKSFKEQFIRLSDEEEEFDDLKERLRLVCNRTLRNQVQEYIKYTKREALTQFFTPSADEQKLYDEVSEYLQRETIYGINPKVRHLVTLMLRKLLSSSTYAIAYTLGAIATRLESVLMVAKSKNYSKEEEIENEFELKVAEDYEEYNEDKEDSEEVEVISGTNIISITPADIEGIKAEIKELRDWENLAFSIKKNAKGEELIVGLEKGFVKLKEFGANEKAVIFTESRRTQLYLYERLSQEEAYKGKIVLFNGDNNDDNSKKIYLMWLEMYRGTDRVTGTRQVDKRQAIVDYFKAEGKILIATEAAAEGINLQFCSLMINYDLPWNPQRVEQRIGRCHRYGQKFDVVVVNFINQANEADKRVYELLDQKFNLFNGVLGASDEILGAIENGVDFEQRIAEIYRKYRTPIEIEQAFSKLQMELEESIEKNMNSTKKKLFENFDEEVHDKLRIKEDKSKEYINKYQNRLLNITKHYIGNDFVEIDSTKFEVKRDFQGIKAGKYKIGKIEEGYHNYRLGHQFSEKIINELLEKNLDIAEVEFDLSGYDKKITSLDSLKGKIGEMAVTVFSVDGLDTMDYTVFSAVCEDMALDGEQCERLFSLKGKVQKTGVQLNYETKIKQIYEKNISKILKELEEKNNSYFSEEYDKLDKWAEDKKKTVRLALKEYDEELKEIKKSIRVARNANEKFELLKRRKNLESKMYEKEKELDKQMEEIDNRFSELLDEMQGKLQSRTREKELFKIRWRVL